MRGAANMRVEEEYDDSNRLIAIHSRMSFAEQSRTIWMDGRPHPGDIEPHTFAGFSTGKFDNNMLNVYTTHLKTSYLRRNGLPRSDKATFTDHWVRHGNYLTVTTVITDPVFLEEPATSRAPTRSCTKWPTGMACLMKRLAAAQLLSIRSFGRKSASPTWFPKNASAFANAAITPAVAPRIRIHEEIHVQHFSDGRSHPGGHCIPLRPNAGGASPARRVRSLQRGK
jgi:hypothetical protein